MRDKKAIALLPPLPAAEGWKPRASSVIGVKRRKVSARTGGKMKQQYLTTPVRLS